MVSFYPFSPCGSCCLTRNIVLTPRLSGKLSQYEILNRDQHVYFVAEKFLEGFAAMRQTRPEVTDHFLTVPARIADAKMVPTAQTYGGLMLLGLLTDATASVRDMLDRGMAIQVPKQQARQTAALSLDSVNPNSIILANPGTSSDH